MSSYDKIEKHYKKLQSVSKSWDEAIEKAKNKVRREYNSKRNELRDKLNKFRGDEQNIISDYQRTDTALNQELTRISNQIGSLEGQIAGPLDPSVNTERKSQQLDQIYGDTHKEMVVVFDRHRDKIKRLEQILAQNTAQEKKMANLGTVTLPTVTPIKAVLDIKNKNLCETINKLEQIREDVEKKIKELAEIDRKEAEDIDHSEKQCVENETKERNEEMNKFVNKIKDSLKKH